MILTSESSKDLAAKIANNLKIPICCVETLQYSYREVFVSPFNIEDNVIAIFPNTGDSNRNVIEFLLMINGFKNVIAVIPYIPYSRQDKSFGLSVIARVLESSGINKIITIDIHSESAIKAFNIPVVNINSFEIFSDLYKDDDEIVVVAPDRGAVYRASIFAEKLNKEIVFMDKNNNLAIDKSKIKEKRCVIVDDIIDSGKTLVISSNILNKNGAKSVEACVTHGIFSSNDVFYSKIDSFYISNTIDPLNKNEKIKIFPIDKVLSDAIIQYS